MGSYDRIERPSLLCAEFGNVMELRASMSCCQIQHTTCVILIAILYRHGDNLLIIRTAAEAAAAYTSSSSQTWGQLHIISATIISIPIRAYTPITHTNSSSSVYESTLSSRLIDSVCVCVCTSAKVL